MDVEQLIASLSQPAAYEHAVERVEVRQTHISAVFLAGEYAYKLKKPVNLGFVDYSSRQARREYCETEVALNRRLAPDVYLGVAPVVPRGSSLAVGPVGDSTDAVDWVVVMRRLGDEETLERRLEAGLSSSAEVAQVGRTLAAFHAGARRGPSVSEHARFEAVSANALDNFSQSVGQIGQTVSSAVFDRFEELTRVDLARKERAIRSRAARHVACDGHGDFRLEHVYVQGDGTLAIVDCIEFSEGFRCGDPIADLAFMVMDLRLRWHLDEADALAGGYFGESEDADGQLLLDTYVAYRAAVRGKVHGIKACESEVSPEERQAAQRKSRAHWLFGLSTLEQPSRRPALLLVSGLPGTGKSTISRGLVTRHGFSVIDSDVVRKQLAGVDPEASCRGPLDQGIYTPEMTARTYDRCLEAATEDLLRGGRVVVDATFWRLEERRRFLRAARELGVAAWVLQCAAPAEVVRTRLRKRVGDVSDAGVEVYDRLAVVWEPDDLFTASRTRLVDTADHDVWGAVDACLTQFSMR